MRSLYSSFFAIVSLLLLGIERVQSHSWIDDIQAEGKGVLGYIRGYAGRNNEVDVHNTYQPGQRSSPVCKPNSQSKPTTPLAGFPRLRAPPGAHILAHHTENGHVSRPEAPDAFSGYTYWYGTSKPSSSHTLQNALDWTSDGRGGKGDGRFLSRSTYDDGECAEPGNTAISKERGVGPTGRMKPCVDNFTLPDDLDIGSTYSVYWVWDFSGHFGSRNAKHVEWYTSCMDIDIVAPYGAGRGSNSGDSDSGSGNTGGGTRESTSSGGNTGGTSNTG
ncbi:hypothetical protein HOY82DRAFT_60650, partial [Tuber indicum]